MKKFRTKQKKKKKKKQKTIRLDFVSTELLVENLEVINAQYPLWSQMRMLVYFGKSSNEPNLFIK